MQVFHGCLEKMAVRHRNIPLISSGDNRTIPLEGAERGRNISVEWRGRGRTDVGRERGRTGRGDQEREREGGRR